MTYVMADGRANYRAPPHCNAVGINDRLLCGPRIELPIFAITWMIVNVLVIWDDCWTQFRLYIVTDAATPTRHQKRRLR